MKHFFAVLDFDKNGLIEREDFINVGENFCALLDYEYGSVAYEEIIEHFEFQWADFTQFIGIDPSSTSDLDHWLGFADKVIVNGPLEEYETYVNRVVSNIFDNFDTNNDGYISVMEFLDFFCAFRIEVRYSAKSFSKIDSNKDGLISRHELITGVKEFFRSDNISSHGNWLFGFWESEFAPID